MKSVSRNISCSIGRHSDGVLLAISDLEPADRDRLAALDVPLVFIDPIGDPDPGTPSIGSANWSGGLTATEHLIGLGHRRIAMIAGLPALLCTQARLAGYRICSGASRYHPRRGPGPLRRPLPTLGDPTLDDGPATTRMAVQLLWGRDGAQAAEPTRVELATSLVIRESTAPPASRSGSGGKPRWRNDRAPTTPVTALLHTGRCIQ